MAPDQTVTVKVDFRMADPEGAAPIRVVAGHAIRVGEAWAEVGARMMDLADSLERRPRSRPLSSGRATMPADPTDIEIAASVRADIAIVKAGASGAAHTLWIDGRAYIISVEPSALNSPGIDTHHGPHSQP